MRSGCHEKQLIVEKFLLQIQKHLSCSNISCQENKKFFKDFDNSESRGACFAAIKKKFCSIEEETNFSRLPSTWGRHFLMNFGTQARREREKYELQNLSVTKCFKHYFNGTNELTLIQLPLKKISNFVCSRYAIGILYCSRSFRVGRRFSLRECKTRRRYLNGTTSSFENPGRESKVVCKLLVWLYHQLYICFVLFKNWRKCAVLAVRTQLNVEKFLL